MVSRRELQSYLHHNIPLSQALGVEVETASDSNVILKAPFAPNINHKKTVFGGSLHAVATLACWSLLYFNLAEKFSCDIVIASSSIQYLTPVISDFRASCEKPDEPLWNRFLASLSKKGIGRIHLSASINQGNTLAVNYQGVFAAIKRTSA